MEKGFAPGFISSSNANVYDKIKVNKNEYYLEQQRTFLNLFFCVVITKVLFNITMVNYDDLRTSFRYLFKACKPKYLLLTMT